MDKAANDFKKWKNPIPSLDDEYVSKTYSITFSFEDEVTLEEAHEGINRVIAENGGRIPKEWIHMGKDKRFRILSEERGLHE